MPTPSFSDWKFYHPGTTIQGWCDFCDARPARANNAEVYATGRMNPLWRWRGSRNHPQRWCGRCHRGKSHGPAERNTAMWQYSKLRAIVERAIPLLNDFGGVSASTYEPGEGKKWHARQLADELQKVIES